MSGASTEARAREVLISHVGKNRLTPFGEANIINAMLAFAADALPGWKLVPVEPTEAMKAAWGEAFWRKQGDCMSPTPTEHPDDGGGPFGYGYRAMLSAAPTPEASAVGNDVVQKSQANCNEAAKEVGCGI